MWVGRKKKILDWFKTLLAAGQGNAVTREVLGEEWLHRFTTVQGKRQGRLGLREQLSVLQEGSRRGKPPLYFSLLFFYLRGSDERDTEDVGQKEGSSGLLPRCLKQPGQGQCQSQEINPVFPAGGRDLTAVAWTCYIPKCILAVPVTAGAWTRQNLRTKNCNWVVYMDGENSSLWNIICCLLLHELCQKKKQNSIPGMIIFQATV